MINNFAPGTNQQQAMAQVDKVDTKKERADLKDNIKNTLSPQKQGSPFKDEDAKNV